MEERGVSAQPAPQPRSDAGGIERPLPELRGRDLRPAARRKKGHGGTKRRGGRSSSRSSSPRSLRLAALMDVNPGHQIDFSVQPPPQPPPPGSGGAMAAAAAALPPPPLPPGGEQRRRGR